MNLSLIKKLTIGSLIGGIIGYLILHPAFMLIDYYVENHNFKLLESFLSSFGIMHIHMTIFFIIIGMVIGLFFGLYNYRVNFFHGKVLLLSITDELTQINNRRHFINELEKEIERSNRFSRNLSLIILDIDKFKYYNDTHGHIFGDKIIQSVARFLTETIRKTDFVARYGGDEFVIVMPETEKSMANVFAERLQKKFFQDFFENHELPIKTKFTISFGIASFPKDAKSVDELIHNADIALYKAKEEGGNTVCNFDKKLYKKSNIILTI
jgi:diguanylate cyclase (GGDEF)-like protein